MTLHWNRQYLIHFHYGSVISVVRNFIHSRNQQILRPEVISEIIAVVGNSNVSTSKSVCMHYGKDEGPYKPCPPNIVVKAKTTEEVSNITKICHKMRIPIIPFGSGSGLEGGTIAIKGGICIDLSQMNRVIEVNADDFDVCVEPGVTRKGINAYLKDTGLWFPVDPGADASIGGMASTSASGTNAVRYGTMRENVLNLEVVLADGTVINTAGKSRSRKTAAGYNLTNLFVGSEGTLGIFTKVTLRLYGIPEMISSAVCNFPSVEDAVRTSIQILQSNIRIAKVEFLDTYSIKACNSYSKVNYKEAPTLFLEFHGTSMTVVEDAKAAAQIALQNGGEKFIWAKDAAERNQLWNARHNMHYAIRAVKPGNTSFISDVCMPLSELPKIIAETEKDIQSQGILGHVLGHVGDGNFHSLLLYDPSNSEELIKIKKIVDRLVKRTWKVGGTCTGEHGIGFGKMHLLEEEIGTAGYNIMRQIKQIMDPLNIMNPGKVVNM